MMAQVDFIQHDFKQSGDVCVLASYYFVLYYYKMLETGEGFEINALFEIYEKYIKKELNENNSFPTLSEKILCLGEKIKNVKEEAKEIQKENIQRLYENFISLLFHFYCQDVRKKEGNGGIRGYQHINEFNEFLNQNKNHYTLVSALNIKSSEYKLKPIARAYEIINDHLSESEHNLAMIVYQSGTGKHSIMIAKNKNEIIYRDSNFNNLTTDKASFDFKFNNQAQISEYILFNYKQ